MREAVISREDAEPGAPPPEYVIDVYQDETFQGQYHAPTAAEAVELAVILDVPVENIVGP